MAHSQGVYNSAVKKFYDRCSFEAKKMIVCRFVKSVHIFRDYGVEVEFNISLDQFKRLVSTMPEVSGDKAVCQFVGCEPDAREKKKPQGRTNGGDIVCR